VSALRDAAHGGLSRISTEQYRLAGLPKCGNELISWNGPRDYIEYGESSAQLPLIKGKERLKRLFKKEIEGLRYNEQVTGDGPRFREHACKLGLEGVISKRADRPYAPGDRGIWVKSKCLNREEFVVVGWTDPEGTRQHIGALLLGNYTEDGRLHYAGRAGTGMGAKELQRLAGVLRRCRCRRCLLSPHPCAITASDLLLSSQKCIGCGRKWSWK
jgi:ATP-dependent DNA ligase